MTPVKTGHSCLDVFRQGAADRAFKPYLVIPAVDHIAISLELFGGLAGDIMHQAAGGITPEQGPLGPFQDFHPVHIEAGKQLRLARGLVAFIDIDRVRRFRQVEEIVLGRAADGELLGMSGAVAGHVHARRKSRQLGTVGKTEGIQLLAGKRGNGNAYVLDGLLAFLRGDDYFFQDSALRQTRRVVTKKQKDKGIYACAF